MSLSYNKEDDILSITTKTPAATSAALLYDGGIAVDLATEDGYEVVGVVVMGASLYIQFGKGYDPETDILLMVRKTNDPAFITENWDFVGYWQADKIDPTAFQDPIGVAIKQASKHFARFEHI